MVKSVPAVDAGPSAPARAASGMLAGMRTADRRDPERLLAQVRSEWGGQRDLWVFGYASLIWRPEFEADEHRAA